MGDEVKMLATGLVFPEGPRWHDGELWFSDIYGKQVMTCTVSGTVTKILDVPGLPSGLGFDVDGRPLVVSMQEGHLLRIGADGAELVADLSSLAPLSESFRGYKANDMVVDGEGRAYIGVYGIATGETGIALVEPGGVPRLVADGLSLANGMVITPDRRRLIVAELRAARLTAFDIAEDGTLHGRRVWADIPNSNPDGICLDAEGAVWVGSIFAREFLRVLEGGEVVQRVPVDSFATAPMLGGVDGTTLFLMVAETTNEEMLAGRSKGAIACVQVDVPGAGWP